MAELDRVLSFVVPERHARGRIVRLGPAMQAVLANHEYPPPIAELLSQALALAALLGSLLKGEGSQITLQAQTEGGIIELLVADYLDGALRGYCKFDSERLALNPSDPSLFALFGKGYLAITFDQALTKERYQGIVPLEGESLCDAVEHYFVQSEQIPSRIRFGSAPNGSIVGALLVQHLADGEVEGRERLHVRMDHPEWEHVWFLAETLGAAELADPELPLETVIWRLFHDEGEVRILDDAAITKGCRCDEARIRSVLERFPPDERTDMADEQGFVSVDCAFCARLFPFALTDLTQ